MLTPEEMARQVVEDYDRGALELDDIADLIRARDAEVAAKAVQDVADRLAVQDIEPWVVRTIYSIADRIDTESKESHELGPISLNPYDRETDKWVVSDSESKEKP